MVAAGMLFPEVAAAHGIEPHAGEPWYVLTGKYFVTFSPAIVPAVALGVLYLKRKRAR